MTDKMTLEEIRAEFADVGIDIPDQVTTREMIEYFRDWEMAKVRRALRNIVPVVVAHGDAQLINDCRVLNRVALTHYKGHYRDTDRRINSGHRGTDVVSEKDCRDALIRAEWDRLKSERGTDRGIANDVKQNLDLRISERQIHNICKR